MWFRNLLIYRITQELVLEAEALATALATKLARPCGSQELTTYGFIPPFGKGADAPLVHESSGFLLIATRKVSKILPGSVIHEALAEKVDAIEEAQQRKVYKKERDQIKDEIIQEYLPRAFSTKKATFAAIMPAEGLIIVDTASPKQAEDLLSTLREVLGSLPVRPVSVKLAPTASLTDWVRTQKASGEFWISADALLRDTDEKGSITAKHQDLTSEAIQLHISTGKTVTKLALAWQDKLSFVLDEGLVIRRLRFEDLLQDQAAHDGGDDQLGQLDASFVLMMLTFRAFIPALLDALGGEEIHQQLDSEPGTDEQAGVPPRIPDTDQHDSDDDDDPLYAEAVKRVRESDRASISSIQRKLTIGYNRAARLIEKMEMAGVVTAMRGNGTREVIR